MSDRLSQDVLLIDDDSWVRREVRQLLVSWGYQVRVASTARRGLAQLERRLPDIVITDLVLPDLSGSVILNQVHMLSPSIPVLVVTGYASLDSAVESLKFGAYDYLLKPITPPELRAALDRASAAVSLKVAQIRGEQLRHINDVALTLAHEINNPLAIIIGELQLRLENLEISDDERRMAETCLESAYRIAATIRSLTDLRDVTYEQFGDMRLINLEPGRDGPPT